METPRISLEIPRFSLKTPLIFIGDSQIFISNENLRSPMKWGLQWYSNNDDFFSDTFKGWIDQGVRGAWVAKIWCVKPHNLYNKALHSYIFIYMLAIADQTRMGWNAFMEPMGARGVTKALNSDSFFFYKNLIFLNRDFFSKLKNSTDNALQQVKIFWKQQIRKLLKFINFPMHCINTPKLVLT